MKITTKLQNIFMFTKVAALVIVIILGIVALCQGKLSGKVQVCQAGELPHPGLTWGLLWQLPCDEKISKD
jgi:L-asparagine transporter-like permease